MAISYGDLCPLCMTCDVNDFFHIALFLSACIIDGEWSQQLGVSMFAAMFIRLHGAH